MSPLHMVVEVAIPVVSAAEDLVVAVATVAAVAVDLVAAVTVAAVVAVAKTTPQNSP